MSKVFLKRGKLEDFLKNPTSILEGFKKLDVHPFLRKNDFVALKIHFGEKGNKSYINPSLLVPLVKFLKKTETRPFLLDTTTLYRGKRSNAIDHINLAYQHGFSKLSVPIIIGDGLKGNDYIEVKINKKHFSTCFLASILKDIDFLVLLSHFTGHMLTGFGAAIKNLGMGCASKKGKLLQHCEVSPQINHQNCIGCGICALNCPVDAIKKEDKFVIVEEKCIGCAQCISVCPTGSIKIIWSKNYQVLGEKMVEYAYAVAKEKKCVYINFCIFVTKECDCMNKEQRGFVQDIGILFSNDAVSIDKASVDLIVEKEKRDVLKEIHPEVDYLHYLEYAQDLGLGELEYQLVEI
jgi:hypothetical protein